MEENIHLILTATPVGLQNALSLIFTDSTGHSLCKISRIGTSHIRQVKAISEAFLLAEEWSRRMYLLILPFALSLWKYGLR